MAERTRRAASGAGGFAKKLRRAAGSRTDELSVFCTTYKFGAVKANEPGVLEDLTKRRRVLRRSVTAPGARFGVAGRRRRARLGRRELSDIACADMCIVVRLWDLRANVGGMAAGEW